MFGPYRSPFLGEQAGGVGGLPHQHLLNGHPRKGQHRDRASFRLPLGSLPSPGPPVFA